MRCFRNLLSVDEPDATTIASNHGSNHCLGLRSKSIRSQHLHVELHLNVKTNKIMWKKKKQSTANVSFFKKVEQKFNQLLSTRQ